MQRVSAFWKHSVKLRLKRLNAAKPKRSRSCRLQKQPVVLRKNSVLLQKQEKLKKQRASSVIARRSKQRKTHASSQKKKPSALCVRLNAKLKKPSVLLRLIRAHIQRVACSLQPLCSACVLSQSVQSCRSVRFRLRVLRLLRLHSHVVVRRFICVLRPQPLVAKKSVVLLPVAVAVVLPAVRPSVVPRNLPHVRARAAMTVVAVASTCVQRLKAMTAKPVRWLQFAVSAIVSVARLSLNVFVLIRCALCVT